MSLIFFSGLALLIVVGYLFGRSRAAAAGRRVRSLEERALAAGRHPIAWDGRDHAGEAMPSGIYLIRVTSALGSATARVVRIP